MSVDIDQKQNTETRRGKMPEAILDILNSTVRIREMILEVDQKETSIATIRASTTTISNCEVITMASMSPFVIVDDASLMKSWVTVVSSSQKNKQDSNVLLPLVGLIALPADPTSQHGDNSDYCEEAGLFEHSIVGHGLSTSSAHLGLGTGPLFDFGRKENALHTTTCGFEVSLCSSRIWNTTSKKVASRGLGMVVTQRGIGCSVSQSTNHLSGTSGMNLNWAGHALLSNSSFSSCHSSSIEDLPPIAPPATPSDPDAIESFVDEYLDAQMKYEDTTVNGNEIWISDCFFEYLEGESGGALFLNNANCDVTIKRTGFVGCYAAVRDGGAIFASFDTPSDHSILLYKCSFGDNFAERHGAKCFFKNYAVTTIAQCGRLEDIGHRNSNSDPLDSFYISSEEKIRVDNSTFEDNRGMEVGALSLVFESESCECDLTDVLFMENEWWTGTEQIGISDVMVSRAGILRTAHCFTTSDRPSCGLHKAESIFEDLIGPSVTSIDFSITITENDFNINLVFEGMFPGTNSDWEVLIKNEAHRIWIDDIKFSHSKSSPMVLKLGEAENSYQLLFDTEYALTGVISSAIFTSSNAFILDPDDTEPDWSWWYQTTKKEGPNFVPITFTTPKEPALTAISAKKDPSDANRVALSLTVSMILGGDYTLVVFDESDTDETDFTITPIAFTDSTTETTGTVTVQLNGANPLKTGTTYKVKSLKSTTLTVSHDAPTFHTPGTPKLTGVPFSFLTATHTTFKLVLEGKDLPEGETFLVELDGFTPTIAVTFISSERGESEELALGWTDTLQFDTSYTLTSVTLSSDPSITIDTNSLVLTTLAQPEPLVLDVGESAHTNARFCGDAARPCSSVDVAWKTVAQYSPLATSLRVSRSLSLLSSVESRKGSVVKIENGSISTVVIRVPESAWQSEKGVVDVKGELTVDHVNIEVSSSDTSFVLFDVDEGTLILQSVHILRTASNSDIESSLANLCLWETGMIQLKDSTAELHSCELGSLTGGAIWMDGGTLALTTVTFVENGHTTFFPSAQKNVRCVSGDITIQRETTPAGFSHWISSDECDVTLGSDEVPAPFFVPSLDGSKSKSVLNKKKDGFDVVIVGTTLIPCSLELEITTTTTAARNEDHQPARVALNYTSADTWNETTHTLFVPSSLVSMLNQDEKWTACIVYGKDQRTDSFVFLPDLKERKAEALQKALPWMIPLIVSVVLVVVCLVIVITIVLTRRRKKQKEALNQQPQEELLEDTVKVEVDSVDGQKTTNEIIGLPSDPDGRYGLSRDLDSLTDAETKMTNQKETPMANPVEAMECEGEFGEVVVDKVDTLFTRLHKGNGIGGVKKREIEQRILAGMTKMVENRTRSELALKLSPHWILLNASDQVFFQQKMEQANQPQASEKPSVHSEQTDVSTAKKTDGIEGIRWRAPEQGEKEGELNGNVDLEKVSVFRLGLLLWEIETGQVPFGEIDAVNAHRQLASGMGLQMSKISDENMQDVIRKCLSVSASDRPSLKEVEAILESPPAAPAKQDLVDVIGGANAS
ncbi:hypothetical protein BLNAU_15289 [Blattamonas nauphoetae]|uniref:Serine-threonine/tyrosine-protein kinase catalytic domain-containing protein n=1 Tax=Blattamonas nauphoetae TaxID=2049346 RepID=A0ABQ9XBA7_9EUKA|nr:hypothetical protein BLNAU_15289 [Blattamonas nauphoetae]